MPRLPRFRPDNDLILSSNRTVASQYDDRSFEGRDELGLKQLGLTINQLWHDNPCGLPIVLARYTFVANVLAGRHDVAEVSLAATFCARIVLQNVKQLTAYVSTSTVVDNIHPLSYEDWPVEVRAHNVLRGPLPQRHESIYSLDMIDHIELEDEDTFIQSLGDSMICEYGILIVGGSALSEAKSSEQGKSRSGIEEDISRRASVAAIGAGTRAISEKCGPRRYPRTAANLKALLDRYFHVVLIFSMIDETIQAGASPSAHYTLAVCSNKKE
jgi:hypothetical protein